MSRFLANLGSLALAFFLAVIVWLIAVRQENPVITDTLQVPVTFIGLSQDLAIVGQPIGQASLQVRAQRRVWEEMVRVEDFLVYADLAGLEAGRHNVLLRADHPSPEVTILSVQPPSAVVVLEDVITRTLPVQVLVVGEPAFGYEWHSAVADPSSITLRGPTSAVNEVSAAFAEVEVAGARSAVERVLPVMLRRGRGEIVRPASSLEVLPSAVEVTVEVVQRPGYRDFSVRVPYIGRPAPGYQITSIVVEPSLVTLRGSPEAFSRLPGYVETVPIDLTDARSDVDAQLALNLPEAVSVVGVQTIQVRIDIQPIMGSRDLQLQPVIRGLGPGLTRTLTIPTVDLVVSGPLPVLSTLDNGAAQVILDLTDLRPGTHTVPLQPVLPADVTVVSVLPVAVDIVISELPTPTPTDLPTVPPIPSPTATPTPGRPSRP
ncbi:MAG: CdaR family protein [Caldilineales bacterium]|nr:CdaR family protein [Caldilineales bacterium]MDW8319039.1 CdaR family protein [Anaerolineae bacterium]